MEVLVIGGDHSDNRKKSFRLRLTKRQTTVTRLAYYGRPDTTYFVYTFDSKGRAIERTTLNADRSLNNRIVYSYDGNGNLSKESLGFLTRLIYLSVWNVD